MVDRRPCSSIRASLDAGGRAPLAGPNAAPLRRWVVRRAPGPPQQVTGAMVMRASRPASPGTLLLVAAYIVSAGATRQHEDASESGGRRILQMGGMDGGGMDGGGMGGGGMGDMDGLAPTPAPKDPSEMTMDEEMAEMQGMEMEVEGMEMKMHSALFFFDPDAPLVLLLDAWRVEGWFGYGVTLLVLFLWAVAHEQLSPLRAAVAASAAGSAPASSSATAGGRVAIAAATAGAAPGRNEAELTRGSSAELSQQTSRSSLTLPQGMTRQKSPLGDSLTADPAGTTSNPMTATPQLPPAAQHSSSQAGDTRRAGGSGGGIEGLFDMAITGMTCEACATRIQRALCATEGVLSADVEVRVAS